MEKLSLNSRYSGNRGDIRNMPKMSVTHYELISYSFDLNKIRLYSHFEINNILNWTKGLDCYAECL